MNANQIAQVAKFLNVAPNQVKRCEEWASVLFVQVRGCRPRFVSKKVVAMKQQTLAEARQAVKDFEASCPVDVSAWSSNQVDEWGRLNDVCRTIKAQQKTAPQIDTGRYASMSAEELMRVH